MTVSPLCTIESSRSLLSPDKKIALSFTKDKPFQVHTLFITTTNNSFYESPPRLFALMFSFFLIVTAQILFVQNQESDYPFPSVKFKSLSDYKCSNSSPCVRKCCGLGYLLQNNTCSPDEEVTSKFESNVAEKLENASSNVQVVRGIMQCDGEDRYFRLEPQNFDEDKYTLGYDGRVMMESGDVVEPNRSCVEWFEDMGDVSVLVCFPPEVAAVIVQGRVNFTGMIISMPFLLITFVVYAILPDRNLHGKALMCYVSALLGAYVLLVYIQLNPDTLDLVTCQSVGIMCLFFFMVSFFWMNVMSIDIWWAFSGLRGFSGSKAEAERKRFLLYCGYAWGVPLLLVILVGSLTLSTSLPPYAWYNPGLGTGQCWLREGVPILVYFYGPMALLILSNVSLFAITAWKIKRVQRDTAMLRKDESKKHSYENDKQRFNLYLKLMLAMGVNWSMEIISWAIDWQVGTIPPAVWYVTDFCNALYGVFLFFIFVFKRNIWKLLKRRYYMCLGKPHLARTMTQNTYSPRTTTMSQISNTEKTFVNDSSVLTSEVA